MSEKLERISGIVRHDKYVTFDVDENSSDFVMDKKTVYDKSSEYFYDLIATNVIGASFNGALIRSNRKWLRVCHLLNL